MDTMVPVEQALGAVGELLQAEGVEARIVIVGGAALVLLGVIARATQDVDVLALATPATNELMRPDPLPSALARAAATVARDFGLAANWLNTQVAGQWDTGLPPESAEGVTWRRFGGLAVGLPARKVLLALKLYAAADQPGPENRHMQDLLALRPAADELEAPKAWILETQDPTIGAVLDKVIAHVRAHVR